ncbi:MAG: tetratricopeptide repeat protein, partial [Gemmatimonadota bacterium]
DKGQYATARARFESAAAANARDAVARYWWGRALLAEDKTGPAAERFEDAIAIDGAKAEYHLWAGNAYGVEAQRANVLRQGLLARRVKAAFERAVALDPTLIDARNGLLGYYLYAPGFMGGSVAKAKEQATALLALDAFIGRSALASVAIKQDDLAGAERELVTLLRDFPDSGRAVASLGNFYADRARPADAFRTFEQWVAKHPKDPLGYYGIGRTAAVTGQQLDRGVAALQMARALPPAADESV